MVKLITVFFDLETPFLWKNAPVFDEVANVKRICRVLDSFEVKAVFNTCGVVAERFPDLLLRLHKDGHEIASHGYRHENFAALGTTMLEEALLRTEEILGRVTGEVPIGVRSPWLVKSEQIYRIFRKRRYKWVSNLDLSNPGRSIMSSAIRMVKLMLFAPSRKPFEKQGLLEIPLLSPLDIYCIQPFPEVTEPSPTNSIEQAFQMLIAHYQRSKEFFNLNFHPQIIGTQGRLLLLERILSYLANQSNIRFVLPRQICACS